MDKFARISVIDGYDREFLSNLNILVVGAGAIGNEVIKNLVLFGIGDLTIIDFDTIEIHNLTRSIFFRESDVGSSKAETVAARAAEVSKETRVKSIHGDVWKSITLSELRTFDAIVCAVDNFEARIKINTLAQLSGSLLLNAGIDHRFVSVEIFPNRSNEDCPCYECSIPASVYEKISARYSCGWIKRIYQKQQTIPTTSITASAVGSIAVSQLFDYLRSKRNVENEPPLDAMRILYDTRGMTISKTRLKRKENCPSPAHREKRVKVIKGDRNFHTKANIFDGLLSKYDDTYIEFSEPILIATLKEHQIYENFFEIAENFDEQVLMINGERALDANISHGMPLQELISNFDQFSIPCKYVTIMDDKLDFDLIMELT